MKDSTILEIRLSNSDFEQLSMLAAYYGISTIDLVQFTIDALLNSESAAEADWQALSLSAFEAGWDNEEDAVYDDWREHYFRSS